jgi:hypothetical protein
MPTVATTTVRTGGVTLVELQARAARPHRLRIDVRCDGPVWPPHDDGAAGWSSTGVTVEVSAGPTGVGFATPAPPGTVEVTLAGAEALDDVPAGLQSWLDAVESRVVTAERLAAAEDLRAATDAVADVGGLVTVERLSAELARDRRLLARLSFPPEELCDRVESVRLPVEPLATVAQARSS